MPKALRRDHCRRSHSNAAAVPWALQLSPHDQLLVLHASCSLTANWPEGPSTVQEGLQVLHGLQLLQEPRLLAREHLLHRLLR